MSYAGPNTDGAHGPVCNDCGGYGFMLGHGSMATCAACGGTGVAPPPLAFVPPKVVPDAQVEVKAAVKNQFGLLGPVCKKCSGNGWVGYEVSPDGECQTQCTRCNATGIEPLSASLPHEPWGGLHDVGTEPGAWSDAERWRCWICAPETLRLPGHRCPAHASTLSSAAADNGPDYRSIGSASGTVALTPVRSAADRQRQPRISFEPARRAIALTRKP